MPPKSSTKPTPDYHHVTDHSPANPFRGKVYEPEADSFLFLDGLDAEREFITSTLKPTVVVEVGVGSGIVCSHCCLLTISPRNHGVACIAIDISRVALDATQMTWNKTAATIALATGGNKSTINLLHSSGVNALRRNTVDLFLFNPPYVPTSTEEMKLAQAGALAANDELPAAWAGGIDGREVCDPILRKVPFVLCYPHGVAYVIAMKENKVDEMLRVVNEAALLGQYDETSRLPPELHATVPLRVMSAKTVVSRWTGENLSLLRFSFATDAVDVQAALRSVVVAAGGGDDDEQEGDGEAEEEQEEGEV